MSKQKTKDNINDIINNVRGKFFTINLSSKKMNRKFCAKLVNCSNSYITVLDVNSKTERKLHKNSVDSIVCGSHTYAR